MIDVLYSQIQFILMVLPGSTIFGSSIRQHAHEFQVMLREKRNNSVVEYIGGNKCILSVIQLGKSDFGVSVYDARLINMSDTFNISHIISVLCDKESRIIGLNLSVSLFFIFRFSNAAT